MRNWNLIKNTPSNRVFKYKFGVSFLAAELPSISTKIMSQLSVRLNKALQRVVSESPCFIHVYKFSFSSRIYV